MDKRIILLRHALTPSNGEGRYIGCRTDEPLSDEGIRDLAKKKRSILSIATYEKVFSGPMKRAKDTAGLLFEGYDITVIEEMYEADFGEFEGKSYEELKDNDRYRMWIGSGPSYTAPGGESFDDVKKRSMAGFYKMLRMSDDKQTIALVCHGGNIMAVMSALTGQDRYDHMVKNLEGYDIRLKWEDERISDLAYDRIGCWHCS